MENVIDVVCHDLKLFLDKEGNVFANFICYDCDQMMDIETSVHQQLSEIYTNTKMKGDFIKRLEYKLRLTMKMRPAKLTFVNQEEKWYLQTLLKNIYEPVTLTYDGTKMGDKPLIIHGKILKFSCDKAEYSLECLVKEIDAATNNFVDKVVILKISDDIKNLYNKKAKEKIKKILNKKSINKRVFIDALSVILKEKVVEVEYDEHKGYTLWTTLEDLIGVYDDE